MKTSTTVRHDGPGRRLCSVLIAVLTCTAFGTAAFAQQPAVYASGLLNPSKIIPGPAGTLLVTETGDTANSGRVSVIEPGGRRRTLLDGLPSGRAGNDPDGPNGLAWSGRTLYVANGEGDSFAAGTTPGTMVPNPAGLSSPLFASIVKFTFNDDIDRVTDSFKLSVQDHYTLLDGAPVNLSGGAGTSSTAELLTQFRWAVPDPQSGYRNSHPYGLTLLPSQPDSLFVADAGMNTVLQVNLTSGRTKTLARFPRTPSPVNAAVSSDAVPTSVRPYGSHLLVSFLSGAPFVSGASRVMDVDPATGSATQFITLLSSTIDVLPRPRSNGATQFYVLEYSTSLLQGQPGRLLLFNGARQVVAENLVTPSSMALDETAGKLYITSRSNGTVLMLDMER